MIGSPEFLRRELANISLHKLEVFCAVIEFGGVRRVAEALQVSQPAVSGHLKDLQTRVGTQLLVWNGHEMRLTEAGRLVHRWAQDLLAATREVMAETDSHQSGERGRAVVATSLPGGPCLVDPIVADFARGHPAVAISSRTSFPIRLAEITRAGECDVAVIVADEWIVQERDLDYEVLGEEEIVLVVRADRPPFGREATAEEVRELRFVGPPRDAVVATAFLQEQLAPLGLLPLPVVGEFDQPDGLKEALRSDVGVTFMTERAVAAEVAAGELRVVRLAGVPLHVPVMLATARGRALSPAQDKLRHELRSTITDELAKPLG
jgi:DNA-binding transcriptional LysR family regulator